MEDLTIIERSVLELIPRGFERKIKVPDICSIIDLDKHFVSKSMTIAKQLVNFQTLGNLSNEALYLVATLPEEERTTGLKAFKNQYKSMEQTITNIEQADLKNWQESLKIAK